MYKKQLFKIALISSPIMAAFEISPVFFLSKQETFPFGKGLLIFTVLVLVIWILNILLISVEESKKKNKPWKRYVFSYLFTLLFITVIWLLLHLFPIPKKRDAPSPIHPIINIIALNTIVLIISNAILMRSKKDQTEAELTNLKLKHLEAEHQQLVQQLQPHFLFNSLSTLKSLIKNDTSLAEEYLVKLSEFLRFTTTAHENTIVLLSKELNFTRDYIDLQKIRFLGSFFCEISIPEEVQKKYRIPVYAMQTLVENALKHNAFSELRPLYLSISFLDEKIIISNNKIAKPSNLIKGGLGLKNLEKRYALLTNNALEIEDAPEQFTIKMKLLKQ